MRDFHSCFCSISLHYTNVVFLLCVAPASDRLACCRWFFVFSSQLETCNYLIFIVFLFCVYARVLIYLKNIFFRCLKKNIKIPYRTMLLRRLWNLSRNSNYSLQCAFWLEINLLHPRNIRREYFMKSRRLPVDLVLNATINLLYNVADAAVAYYCTTQQPVKAFQSTPR
jgi:hypothetical protein